MIRRHASRTPGGRLLRRAPLAQAAGLAPDDRRVVRRQAPLWVHRPAGRFEPVPQRPAPVAAFRDALRESRPAAAVQVRRGARTSPSAFRPGILGPGRILRGRLIVPTYPGFRQHVDHRLQALPRSGANAPPSGCARARRPARHSPWPRHRHARGSAGSRLPMDIAGESGRGGRWMAGSSAHFGSPGGPKPGLDQTFT